MKVLGVHIGHDSGASLVNDGRLVADVTEERFVRIKHYSGLPINAIEYCLRQGQCSLGDIDAVAVPSKLSTPELNHLFALTEDRKERGSTRGRMLEWARRLSRSAHSAPPLYLKRFPVTHRTAIVHVDHHLAHAASAYYTSGLTDPCLIVTLDGLGDGAAVCVWRGEHGRISLLQKFGPEGSLGWFYSNVTEALGWWHGDGEGKTMGLAPYGDDSRVTGKLERFYPKYEGGRLVEPHDFGIPCYWNEGGAFQWHFDEAYEIQRLIDRHGREDIAAEAQRILEEQVLKLVLPWLEKANTKNLVCAGGVFLNVKLNQRLWYSERLENHWIYPNPGDAGLAAGAALHVYHTAQPGTPPARLEHLYLGPAYSDGEIASILECRGLRSVRHHRPEEIGAEKLSQGKIVGWFQGRMEAGPRALGARSIIMGAGKAENKDVINARVKFREAFRPFCPSLLDEHRNLYLCQSRSEPFMITSFDVPSGKRERIPAVVHKDNTARPQTVTRDANPRYHELIRLYGEMSGDPVILNTSFNIKGEPIVCHPRDAIRCFFDTGLDVLILGDSVVEKQ